MLETLIKLIEKLLVALKKYSPKPDTGESNSSRHKIQSALDNQQQLFFEMLDNLPILFHLQSQDYSIPYANKMFRQVFGDPSGKACHKTMHGRDLPCEQCAPFRIMQTGNTEESVWQANNGKTYLTVMTPFKNLTDSNLVMEMAIDISALKETEEELTFAKEEAEWANSAKSKFLSRMSHELRTPLNGILGFSDLLLDYDRDGLSSTQKKDIEQINQSGKDLLGLINEILYLSEIESSSFHTENAPVEVSSIINEVLSLMDLLAIEKSVSLINGMKDKQELWVNADAVRLNQVLKNLVANAIQYNKLSGGTVKLSCESQPGDKLRIKIEDSGKGIPDSQHSLLFGPFNRAEQKFKIEEGLGLGLPISKELVSLMGGELNFFSQVGQGSCFFIDLPVCQAPEKSIAQNIPLLLVDSEDVVPDKIFSVLYIEDNVMNRKVISKYFGFRKEIKFLEASDATEGIRLARDCKPDLILMDITLPKVSGIEAFKILKQHVATKSIPVVAISANVHQEDIDQALALGFSGYLTKPVDFKKLASTIEETLHVNLNR